MKEFLFDARAFVSVRISAANVAEARAALAEHLDCATANFGSLPNGDPLVGEVSLDDGWFELIEVDGEPV